MGGQASKNFYKRFSGGIEVRYAETPLSDCEQTRRNKIIAEAFYVLLKDVLGREPTHEEFLGLKKIEIKKRKQ
ncbi:MAG: hypothetical protein KKH94_01670 [Candidatus Omnitrophica bacterium]|nr:hypothetical protein [Candidatus Omnitrophota bacterium]